MALADIKKKIEGEAQREAEEILERAEEKKRQIALKTQEEIDSLERASAERLKKEEKEIFRRREIVADLDVKKIELGVRRSLIERTYDEALRALAAVPKAKYIAFMTSLLENAQPEEKDVLLLATEERHLDQAWLDGFNQKKGMSVTLGDRRVAASGGFVLQRGKVDINCTLEMLVRSVQEEIEAEVVQRLFPS
ncbi:V-type ATP synthase subunit E [Aminiphilus circumscriptus]|jgi:V/A-type H+-transporting ATPase subunit E|uniref:V-type ATP synthase subunit E n=1 Tax=Aminiphilus circumscriptus TaxID=290732 RepID=UPI0004923BAD|nr:V-type ATP synthase subunit E family protein [Aminiphilus circumscriptus]